MKTETTYEVTWLIRRIFRAMAERADQYLKDYGLTATDRALLEFLHPDVRLTVPALAKRYQVSRQHIQKTVNHLIDIGLIRSEANPDHRRSSLLRLSKAGRETFADIRQIETRYIEALFADISGEDLKVTHRSLASLLDKLG